MLRRYAHGSITLLLSTLLLSLGACAGTPEARVPAISRPRPLPPPTTVQPAPAPRRAETPGIKALGVARGLLGTPYRYGGNNPTGFDCSGLVQYSFGQAGLSLPRRSSDQFRASQLIPPAQISPGDLVFFRISRQKVSHVGIYAGQGRFIHAPSSGKGVSYANLSEPYWRQRLVGVGRF